MQKFILQSDNDNLDAEVSELKTLLDAIQIPYIISEEAVREDIPNIAEYIPIGSIPFVEAHLQTYFGTPYSCPIEIPKFLRTPDILHRRYDIMKVKNLPKNGAYFLKSAQHLKTVQYCGLVDHAFKMMEPDDWCVISEPLPRDYIIDEYRIFVHKGKIQAIKSYTYASLGVNDFSSTPPDQTVLDKIVKLMNKHFPIQTYSFDVGILETSSNHYVTFLIEVHLVSSLGTYGFKEPALIDMYYETYNFMKSEIHLEILNNRNLIW